MSTLDQPRLDAIQEAFDLALALAPVERETHLIGIESTDPDLARRLRSLLQHDAAPPDWLRDSALDQTPPPEDDLPPPVIPGFEILGRLGSGGMGIVYRARQFEPDRPVAIKTIRPELLDPRRRELFQREIDALARLRHPAIAHIYAAGVDRSAAVPRPWFAMELIEGRPLLAYFRETSAPPAARLQTLADIADAIAHAHAAGIVHRDLKPSNIIIDAHAQPRILDFGIAKVVGALAPDPDRSHALTATAAAFAGTIPYIAPEQLGAGPSRPIDARADVHALGVITFEALTGRPPYDRVAGAPVMHALHEFLTQTPRRLRAIDPRMPRTLDTILAHALARDPDRRLDSASRLASDLRRAAPSLPQSIAAPAKTRRRRPQIAAITIAILLPLAAWPLLNIRGSTPSAPAGFTAPDPAASPLTAEIERLLADHPVPEGQPGLDLLDRLSHHAMAAAGIDDTQRARWHLAIGRAYLGRGEIDSARERVGSARVLLPSGPASILPEQHMLTALQANILAARGNFMPAANQLQRARAAAEALGDHAAAAEYAASCSSAFLSAGHPVPAAAIATRALEHAAQSSDPAAAAAAHGAMALALAAQSRHDEAASHALLARDIIDRIPAPHRDRLARTREAIQPLLPPQSPDPG